MHNSDDSDEESAVVRKEKRLTKGKLFQKTNSKSHNKFSGFNVAVHILDSDDCSPCYRWCR